MNSMNPMKPKITQPGKTRYETWLEINDDLLFNLTKTFMDHIEWAYGINFDRSRLIDLFLRFVYDHSSTRMKRAQREYLIHDS